MTSVPDHPRGRFYSRRQCFPFSLCYYEMRGGEENFFFPFIVCMPDQFSKKNINQRRTIFMIRFEDTHPSSLCQKLMMITDKGEECSHTQECLSLNRSALKKHVLFSNQEKGIKGTKQSNKSYTSQDNLSMIIVITTNKHTTSSTTANSCLLYLLTILELSCKLFMKSSNDLFIVLMVSLLPFDCFSCWSLKTSQEQ